MPTVNYAERRKKLGYWLRVEYGRNSSGGIYETITKSFSSLEELAEVRGNGFSRGRLNLYNDGMGIVILYCCNLGAGERSEFLKLMGVEDERFL